MRWIVIILAVVGLAFLAFMLIGSNRESGSGADYEPPDALAWLKGIGGAPRLVEEPVRFPRDGGGLEMPVVRSCGKPARLATFQLLGGTEARVVYRCFPSPDPNCRGASRLCEQAVRLVPAGGDDVGDCNEDNVCQGEATLSIGPEGGTIEVQVPVGGAAVELR